MAGCGLRPSQGTRRSPLEFLRRAPAPRHPRECPFHYPAAVDDGEALDLLQFPDVPDDRLRSTHLRDLHRPAADRGSRRLRRAVLKFAGEGEQSVRHPVPGMNRTALKTSRMSGPRRRPVLPGGGMRGSIAAHSPSVKSVTNLSFGRLYRS